MVNGEVTLVMRSGEQLNFRRGMSLGMQEVATAIKQFAGETSTRTAQPPPRPAPSSQPTLPVPEPPLAPSSSAWSGRGDDVIQFDSPVEGLTSSASAAAAPWRPLASGFRSAPAAGAAGQHRRAVQRGLRRRYAGPLGGLQINATGAWSIEPLDAVTLPVFDGAYTGSGDAAIFMRPSLEVLDTPKVLRVQATGRGTVSMWAYGMSPALLINTMGSYAGTVIVPDGTQLLAIGCDGNWSLTQ